MLLPMPEDMRHKILAYKSWKDRQSRILGKWLLIKLIKHFNLKLTLNELQYSVFNKPYFDLYSPLLRRGVRGEESFDFSIAHSADIVLCAGTLSGRTGADIELVSPRNLDDYHELLTASEWKYINQSPDQQSAFYQIWTKKEALIKALGRGIDMDFDQLDVSEETILYEETNFFFRSINIAANYIAHIATSAPSDSASVSFEMLSAPL